MQGLNHKDILLVLREILLLEERHRHKQIMAAQRVRALTEFCTRFTWQQKKEGHLFGMAMGRSRACHNKGSVLGGVKRKVGV